ncbi:GNAT family N-acetyltransferase [Kribbella sp. CA-253562]|uniref:GNAT family N-acetyltransferase n=1 Tax=Kribbella sp. CA-253562 TaxID=3239942 RepID=UPI003D8A94C2
MLEATLTAWVHGWSISRGSPAPVPAAGGHRIEVGLPRHLVRYVTPSVDQTLVDELQAPGTWLKTCGELPELDDRWKVERTEYLMAVDLEPVDPTPNVLRTKSTDPLRHALRTESTDPPRHVLRTESTGPLIHVTAEIDGVVAARGQVAVWGDYAVIDQVVTEPAYRRQGLGSVVMRGLTQAAVEQGARTGVLVATDAGRALYSRLGWELVSPVRVAWISPG